MTAIRLARLLLVGLAVAATPLAQDAAAPTEIETDELAPGADADVDGEAPDEPAEDPEPTRAERAAALVSGLSSLQFERDPETLLRHLGQRGTDDAEFFAKLDSTLAGDLTDDQALTAADVAETFREWLLGGDWEDIGRFLEALDEDSAAKVFATVLGACRSQKVWLVADEILALADASPTPPDDEQLAQLGQMLATAGRLSGHPGGVIAALEDGESRHLGGDDPEARRRAARLLIGAGLPVDAAPFLPELDDALEDGDGEAVNLHALVLATRAAFEDDEDLEREAWRLRDVVLTTCDHDDAVAAADALTQSWPTRPRDWTAQWQRELMADHPARANVWFGAVMSRLQGLRHERDGAVREAWLDVVAEIADEIASSDTPHAGWPAALGLLTHGWLEEVYFALGGVPLVTPNQGAKSPGTWVAQQVHEALEQRRKANTVPLDADALLARAPDEDWLAIVDADVRERVEEASAALAAHTLDLDAALAAVASADAASARELTDRLVRRWIARRDPNAGRPQRYYWFWSTRSYTESVPLTRARQRRNLTELAELLDRLHVVDAPRPSPAVLVEAFAASHSPAEVYRREDVERVFGAYEEIPIDVARALAADLRDKVTGQWQSLDVQVEMNTRRTDDDLALELERGYAVGIRLLEVLAEAHPDDADVVTDLAALLFDQAEFLYGQEADLEVYAAARNRSFEESAEATRRYAAGLERNDTPTARHHFRWFRSALGASDLGRLERATDADAGQVETIRADLLALPERHREAHLALFGERLVGDAQSVPPELKPRYFRHGLRILGDHPSGSGARELLTYYDDLLEEIELAVVVDGSTDVGHVAPFGVHVLLRSTRELARETDAFRFLLQNDVRNRNTASVDHRDDLGEQIREVFGEAFDVHAVTFHDPTVTPHGLARSGWQQTPIAYVAMTPRDPATDRIPALQLDLDFADVTGSVILPVRSDVVLIDARSASVEPRPVADLHALVTLDDRALGADDTARVEVTVTTHGLPPTLEQLFETVDDASPGFELTDVTTHDMDVTEVGTEDEPLAPLCTRSWTLAYRRVDEEAGSFVYPRLALAGAQRVPTYADDTDDIDDDGRDVPPVRYTNQRFADADIVDVDSDRVSIEPVDTSWRWFVAAGVSVVVGVVLVRLWRRRPTTQRDDAGRHVRPARITPFSSIALLRRIADDHDLRLTEAERAELGAAIDGIETRYFANGAPAGGDDEMLESAVSRWLTVAERR